MQADRVGQLDSNGYHSGWKPLSVSAATAEARQTAKPAFSASNADALHDSGTYPGHAYHQLDTHSYSIPAHERVRTDLRVPESKAETSTCTSTDSYAGSTTTL